MVLDPGMEAPNVSEVKLARNAGGVIFRSSIARCKVARASPFAIVSRGMSEKAVILSPSLRFPM